MKGILLTTCLALFILGYSIGYSQELELSKIMAGNEFIGHQPEDIVWSHDSKSFFFQWDNTEEYRTYYTANPKTGNIKKIPTKDLADINYNGFYSSENGQFTYSKRSTSLFKLNGGKEEEVFSYFDAFYLEKVTNKGEVFINVGNNIFVLNSETGTFRQLTNFVSGSEPTKSENPNYLEEQQLELFQIQKQRKLRKYNQEEFLEKSQDEKVPPFYLDGWSIDWIEISDNKKWMLFELSKYPKNQKTSFPSYVNESGETQTKNARPKVGTKNPEHKLLLFDFEKNKEIELDFSDLEGRNTSPEFLQDYQSEEINSEIEGKDIIFHGHGFNAEQNSFLLEVKSYDNKDRWILTIDQKGELQFANHQHDKAWIGGPGISGWNMVPGNAGWMNESLFFFQSEISGFSHLYSYDMKNAKTSQLTEGNYEIHEAYLNKDRSAFFISANKSHPGNRDFLMLDIKTNELKEILNANGKHEVLVSPDESQVAVRYSSRNNPWEIYMAPLKEKTQLQQLTESQSEEFKAYDWRIPEIITFQATDNQNVNARIYEPKEGTKNGAAVIFVHGAGYLQNAHNWWSGYYREYMFNNLLADKGFTVLDIDYRASKGYGRDFRTGIYRYMGGKDLADNMDGRQHLINEYDIDPERIGMYGGSYGGFITLMALLTEPGKLKCGAAIRSVTDWAHYNHAYTSNILNTPEEDPEAYRKSSPIYYAQNLEDQLLMLHGVEDDNVQYQDVVRLSQRFIELGKSSWDLVGYPIEPHGFKETSSWTDEYRRILKLFEEELLKKN